MPQLFPKVLPSDPDRARTSEAIAVSAVRGRGREALRADTADVAILCGTHSRGPLPDLADLADLEHLKCNMIYIILHIIYYSNIYIIYTLYIYYYDVDVAFCHGPSNLAKRL